MDATLITALGGLLTVVGGVLVAIMTARSAAQKAETESLRLTLVALREECTRKDNQINVLETENERLTKRIKTRPRGGGSAQ